LGTRGVYLPSDFHTMSASATPPQTLKERFTDDWYKFTDEFDETLVNTVLDQHIAPDNEPHSSYKSSFVQACANVANANGEAFEKAVQHLQARKG
jgi:hypothetical protein